MPDTIITDAQPGDIGFHRDRGMIPWFIRFAEGRKYGAGKTPDDPAFWNHTFMVGARRDDGALSVIEANPGGVRTNSLTEYAADGNLRIARPPYRNVQVALAMMDSLVGSDYGYLSIISDAAYLLFDATLRLGVAGHHTCSGAVAHALQLCGFDMGDDEEWNSPADNYAIAKRFGWQII